MMNDDDEDSDYSDQIDIVDDVNSNQVRSDGREEQKHA